MQSGLRFNPPIKSPISENMLNHLDAAIPPWGDGLVIERRGLGGCNISMLFLIILYMTKIILD